jgi:hypothetical protein
MPLTLLFFPLSSAWAWIASLDIIDVFHIGLPRPYSYHQIPYVFGVKVQCVLRIPLVWLVVNPFNITI